MTSSAPAVPRVRPPEKDRVPPVEVMDPDVSDNAFEGQIYIFSLNGRTDVIHRQSVRKRQSLTSCTKSEPVATKIKRAKGHIVAARDLCVAA